jgi:hypothetical protein
MSTRIVAATGESAKPVQWRLKITFWLDVTLLVSICALQTVRFTGLVLHEWLGLAMVGMVLAHLLLAWSWIASQSRRFFTLQSIRARINYLLNLSLFAAVTAVIFSGILISQKAIPRLTGSKAAPDIDWRWLLLRLALLSLAAAAFAALTGIYGRSVRPPLPNPRGRAARRHRPSAPEAGLFSEFVGEGMIVAIFAVGGRILFQLRLSPASPVKDNQFCWTCTRKQKLPNHRSCWA